MIIVTLNKNNENVRTLLCHLVISRKVVDIQSMVLTSGVVVISDTCQLEDSMKIP